MSQNDKILKWFFYISAVIIFVGTVVIIDEDGLDIYSAWNVISYAVGIYLINKLK